MAPEVAGSSPVSHPGEGAEVRSSIGRAPVSKTGGCRFDSCRACWPHVGQVLIGWVLVGRMALSSRGLGRGPLKAQTRVRIPLALLGPIVYRLGRDPFKVQRGVRLPLGLWWGRVEDVGLAPLAQLAEQVTLNH